MKEDNVDQIIENRIKNFSPGVDLEKKIMDSITRHEKGKLKFLYWLEIAVSALTVVADVAAVVILDYLLTRFQVVFYLFRVDITALRLWYYALFVCLITAVGAIMYIVARWSRNGAAGQPDAAA